ncbi:MAG TPA: hypothetical protein VJG13_16235, partial [Thermoanaerobaculia bacterium]|nr:hypothetical protein [Thermoanaerobaculia bacterium]
MDHRLSPCSRSLLALLLGLFAPAAPAAASAPMPQPPPDQGVASFDESVAVSWVLVPVVVRARQGHVEGLGREDFRLSIDGRPAPIDELDLGEDVPLSVVYLQDLSGSVANA